MQLVAYGAQDIYLTGNPQITFFKVVYRRHTNFAIEAIEQTFTGNIDFGRKISCTVDRNGDLVTKMYLDVDVDTGSCDATGDADDLTCMVHRFGHAMVREVEVEIGGQIIDKHYGEWLEIWSQMCCDDSGLTTLRTLIGGSIRGSSANTRKMYIPLQFWFNRNPGLALPLIALQYHEVKINVLLEERCKLNVPEGLRLRQVSLYCDYIYLDTEERRRFAQVSHEYLIDQVQFNNVHAVCKDDKTANIDLRFNHPCKELFWVAQPREDGLTSGRAAQPFRFSHLINVDDDSGVYNREYLDTVASAKLQLNGLDRFSERDGTYFRCVQPYQHHTGGHRRGRNHLRQSRGWN